MHLKKWLLLSEQQVHWCLVGTILPQAEDANSRWQGGKRHHLRIPDVPPEMVNPYVVTCNFVGYFIDSVTWPLSVSVYLSFCLLQCLSFLPLHAFMYENWSVLLKQLGLIIQYSIFWEEAYILQHIIYSLKTSISIYIMWVNNVWQDLACMIYHLSNKNPWPESLYLFPK